MTDRLIVLRPNWEQIPPEAYAEAAKLGAGADYSDRQLLKRGDRPIHEYTDDLTKHRPAPWIVMDEGECYVTHIQGQAFEEVWIFKCGWQPLSEAKNPWREVQRADPATHPTELLAMMGIAR